MEDMEKARVEYVTRIEAQLDHVQKELAKYKSLAERWAPVLNVDMNGETEVVKFSLSFGGKVLSATMTYDYILQTDETTLVTGTVDVLANSIISDRLREIVKPEIQRTVSAVNSIKKAGKW
jgi:hypothetical protein